MDRPYLALDLVDDHVPRSPGTDFRLESEIRQVIGVYVIAGSVPRVVACGPDLPQGRHPKGELCLNEVMVEGGLDHSHRGHLTKTSLCTLSENQLRMLHTYGTLEFESPGCYVELLGDRAPEELDLDETSEVA